MKNKYGHEIINFPQKRTFKKWILGLSKEERVKLETLPEQIRLTCVYMNCNCPLAKFMQFYTGKNIICGSSNWFIRDSPFRYKLPNWAKTFITEFDSGKIQNLRQWASQKES